jgi:hypothetical protein
VAALRHSSTASSGKDVVRFVQSARTRRCTDSTRDGRSSAANWYAIDFTNRLPRPPPNELLESYSTRAEHLSVECQGSLQPERSI